MNSPFTHARNASAGWNRLDNYLIGKINANKVKENVLQSITKENFYSEFSRKMQKSSTKFINSVKPFFSKIIF